MGYRTKHAIRIINKYNTRSNLKKLNRVIKLVSEYSFDIKGATLVDFSSLDSCGFKWYEYENDMRIVSKLLPKLEIEICGKGERPGDEWCYIFKNGNVDDGGDVFIEEEYDSDFYDETKANHCSIISCSSSEEYISDDDE